jgi:hypothetical protein
MAADTIEVARPSPAMADSAEIDGHSPTPADLIEAEHAPGWPGTPGRWTSSAKSGVGTALNPLSEVWFTLSHGILNEIYYPRIDQACTRDLGLIVTDGASFFSEEKRHAKSVAHMLEHGVPAYLLVNTCASGFDSGRRWRETVPYRHRDDAGAWRRAVFGRDHRQPVGPLGLQQRR